MDPKRFFIFLSFALLMGLPATVFSQDFVYKPVNPAFGGETFNYQWLLSGANAQNLLRSDDETTSALNQRTTVDDFTESLNRQLLSQLSRQLITNQFGEEGLNDGTYTVGDFQIEVGSTIDGLSITILDTSLGERTEIVIPFF
ncbi:MAG: curli production assembly/transport component CsgF [Bacteroidota bacterium]